ncbi:zinc finger BED domain-containing protein 4-like [Crassostrea virginica]
MTVDNASNMSVALEVAGAQKLGCLAHTLNLASNKAMSIQSLQRVLAKVRSIVTFFHKSNIATEMLKEKQLALQLPQHKLINDCKTRWNSTYQMIQRFLNLAENEVYFPKLVRLARTYFCVQATSVASERVFSTTGDIVSATRACLSAERVNELVFLKKNMKF